jgi:hypothetical protein
MPFVFSFAPVLFFFLGGQVYFLLRAVFLIRKRVHPPAARLAAYAALLGVYAAWFALGVRLERGQTPTHLTLAGALISMPFLWWLFSSTVGFLAVVVVWVVKLAAMAVAWAARGLRARPKAPAACPSAPSRRRFLERAVVGAPFVAGAYGMFYGRLNLEITHPRIRLPRLPKAFSGFRIAQLTDIHIGPFMSEGQIRKFVEITNSLKPDLIALTGDFITWDRSTEEVVVRVLAGLKAPFGVFGCLGNHETWSNAEDSITRLFAQAGIPILRGARVPIAAGGEQFNLIGVDYGARRPMMVPHNRAFVRQYLRGVEPLIAPGSTNILLSHNPETFDRAADLGIDFSLAGHTHGGQVALEFISPEIAPSRLITPYVSGWFEQPGGQLYVSRGIGTIAAPMRIGASPEIPVFELVREG